MTLRQRISAFFAAIKYWNAFRELAQEEWDKISPLDPDQAVDELTEEQKTVLTDLADEFEE